MTEKKLEELKNKAKADENGKGGDVEAQCLLTEYFLMNEEAQKIFSKVFYSCNEVKEHLAKASKNCNSAPALFRLAKYFRACDYEPKLVGQLMEKSANLGHLDAMYELSELYEGTYYVAEKDERKSLELCKRAAELGHNIAQYFLGYKYRDGRGVAPDKKEAIKWWSKVAENPKNLWQKEAAAHVKLLTCNRYVNTDEKLIPQEKRMFAKISKEELYNLVKKTCDELEEKFYTESICLNILSIEKDLSNISFSFENADPFEKEDFTSNSSIRGFCTLENGLTFWGGTACGDWEAAVYFIIYYDGKNLRGYIPSFGNLINLDAMTAFGSEGEKVSPDELRKMYPNGYDKNFHPTQAYLKKYNICEIGPSDLEINYDLIKKELLTVFKKI